MATYIEVNGSKYKACITGRLNDKDWDNRASKAIHLEMTYEEATSIFVNNIHWNIIQEIEVEDNAIELETYDNSEYSIAGDIIDHRDGTVTVKMGKQTAEELVEILDAALLEATYLNVIGGNK